MKSLNRQNFIKRNLPLLIAFLVPIAILVIIYATREIYPFGEEMYLRSDMYHQYAPFLKEFQRILQSGGSLHHTWHIGLGSNFYSTFAYYIASPVNWLAGLISPDYIPEIMSCFLILKSGLMSAFMTFYLHRRFRNHNISAAAFGICYALSGYMAAYSWNVMWLDCLVILPLLILGLERLVKEKKVLLYTICFAFSVLSNYYIAIMLCFFSVLYVIYLLAVETEFRDTRELLRHIGKYLLYSFLGGCIGAISFLPALSALFGTASAGSAFPARMTAYYNLLEMFAHGAMNTKVTMMNGYVPNIYAGIIVFALIPLFWLNRAVPVKQRAGKTILMAILIFSFTFNVPAFIWHGFHFPNSLPSRQSFIYIFLVLVMSYEAWIHMRNVSTKQILLCFGAAILAVFALQVLYSGEEYPMSIAYASSAFLICYGILSLMRVSKRKTLRLITAVMILVVCAGEMLLNTDETGYSTTSRTAYVEDNAAIDSLLQGIKDEDFYRVEKVRRRTKNDGAWSGYRSASIFSSVTSEALSDFYESFGMQSGTNSFSFYGHTPFTAALLGVRYQLSDEALTDRFLEPAGEEDGMYLYKSRYCLPLGFMVSRTTQAEVNLTDNNPFEVQNDFLDAACGAAPIYTSGEELEGEEISYMAEETGRLFFYIDRKVKSMTLTRMRNGYESSSRTYTSIEGPMILDAGEVTAGEELKLTISDDEETEFAVTPAVMDDTALSNAIRSLSQNVMQNIRFGDDWVSGEVQTFNDGTLFTTIPYDKGWRVYVDGKQIKTDDFYEAFIQVPLTAGSHRVEFRYHVPGLTEGIIISCSAIFVLVLVLVIQYIVKKKKEVKNDETSLFEFTEQHDLTQSKEEEKV